jgi:RimJ/RimL family protein N-acetyltransferase
MLENKGSVHETAALATPLASARRLTETDIPAMLALQHAAIAALSESEKHFLKPRTPYYLSRLIQDGIGIGMFLAATNQLVAQALLRRQSFTQHEANCNVNNFLQHAPQRVPTLAHRLLPELHQTGWGVIGTLLVSPDPAFQRKGLARQAIAALMETYQRQGGKHLFASTAIENAASRKIFAAQHFERLAEAIDPKDGWRCVILHYAFSD